MLCLAATREKPLPSRYLTDSPRYLSNGPVLYYDKQSRGAKAYLALAGEINRRYDSSPMAQQEPGADETGEQQ